MTPPVLVFVQSKQRARELYSELMYDNIKVDVVHADKTQEEVRVICSFELMLRGGPFHKMLFIAVLCVCVCVCVQACVCVCASSCVCLSISLSLSLSLSVYAYFENFVRIGQPHLSRFSNFIRKKLIIHYKHIMCLVVHRNGLISNDRAHYFCVDLHAAVFKRNSVVEYFSTSLKLKSSLCRGKS